MRGLARAQGGVWGSARRWGRKEAGEGGGPGWLLQGGAESSARTGGAQSWGRASLPGPAPYSTCLCGHLLKLCTLDVSLVPPSRAPERRARDWGTKVGRSLVVSPKQEAEAGQGPSQLWQRGTLPEAEYGGWAHGAEMGEGGSGPALPSSCLLRQQPAPTVSSGWRSVASLAPLPSPAQRGKTF